MLKTFLLLTVLVASISACCQCNGLGYACLPECCPKGQKSVVVPVEDVPNPGPTAISVKQRSSCSCHYVPPLGLQCTCPFKK